MKTPRFWQEHSLASTALLPLAGLYGVGAWLDRTFTKAQTAPLSILAIGNATAGGAGKTPTALALAPLLRELGHIPHFATRGYGAATPLHAHRVSDKDDAAHVGDEALLLARIAPTWVGRDRLAAANAAREAGATLLICDDALQHHRLKKDLTLLVIDGPFGIGNGRLLPAGPLREPFSTALTRSDAAIFIGADSQQLAAAIEQPIFHAHLAPSANMPSLKDGP